MYDPEVEEEKCIYTPKYGIVKLTTTHFDDHSLLGANYLRYKPERISVWICETQGKEAITGIQTWFRNVIDNSEINSGENKGIKSETKKEIIINPNEYLIDCKLWFNDDVITKIYLKTNKGNKYEVGKEKGVKYNVDLLNGGKKIIISFFGSYNEYLESFGLHVIEKKDYMTVLFTGYFELKAKLKKEKYRDEILEKLKNKKYTFQEETIIRTCMLPNTQFNEVMKFCVI